MLKSRTTYPLKDPERYDDDYGEGFTHAAVADDVPEGCWMADCWIVDVGGNVHPGYNCEPMPIRAEDLEIEKGFPTVMEDRARKGVIGWGR